MISTEQIETQIPLVLTETNFDFLGPRYKGKVRDNYVQGELRYLITSDRLSCFDVVVTCIPFKGQVLNQLALHWFELTKDIVPNHIVAVPDPNVMVVRNCQILPVEVIVRGYLTGSAWRDYQAGRAISGVRLPEGLRASEKLPQRLITPSTKAEQGAHDEPISEEEIVKSGLVDAKLWAQVREIALALFDLGSSLAEERGLIMVDTKYEFGLLNGQLVLVDEIHTLDSSRYWVKATYPECYERGESPEMLDKEPMRQWLLTQGYQGDGPVPEFSVARRVDIARHYIDSYELVAAAEFCGEVGPVAERVERNLRAYLSKH